MASSSRFIDSAVTLAAYGVVLSESERRSSVYRLLCRPGPSFAPIQGGSGLTDEDAFIRAILADPREVTLRLVYADRLDERGGAACATQSEYLRVECELDGLPSRDSRRRRLRDRLTELRKAVGDDWWQRLDSARVDYCVEFQYRCTGAQSCRQATPAQ